MGWWNTWRKFEDAHKNVEVKEVPEVVEPEPAAPTTRRYIHKIVMVNNKTDKEIEYVSENEFGLYHHVSSDKSIFIRQFKNIERTDWFALCRLYDFSIARFEWKTVSLVKESTKELLGGEVLHTKE